MYHPVSPFRTAPRVSALPYPPDRTHPAVCGHGRIARSLGVLFVVTTAGCLGGLRSTTGGRRESRRECLAAARNAGWRVVDIGAADFKGAARYEVTLVVERDSVPRQSLRCAYDFRLGLADLKKVGD